MNALPLDDRCPANSKQTGNRCGNRAGKGTEHVGVGLCSAHGGNSPGGKAQASKLIAGQEARRLALPVDIDPSTALLEEVHRTAGWVAWLEHKVNTHGEDYLLTTTINGEQPGPWLNLLNEQRKHLAAVCTAAIRAGVEERRVRLAEKQGDALVALIRGILDDLDLSAEQRALVPQVVPRHLRSITSGAA